MGSNGSNTNGQSNKTRRQSSSPIEVRRSTVHGLGVFATGRIPKRRRIIEYTGERMAWDAASEDPDDPHTFLFGLSDSNKVINAAVGGNESRWINHSCDPNCEAVEERGRVFIYALRDIGPGEELSYDYSLEIDEPRTAEMKRQFHCHCGTTTCRGTLLAPEEEAVTA